MVGQLFLGTRSAPWETEGYGIRGVLCLQWKRISPSTMRRKRQLGEVGKPNQFPSLDGRYTYIYQMAFCGPNQNAFQRLCEQNGPNKHKLNTNLNNESRVNNRKEKDTIPPREQFIDLREAYYKYHMYIQLFLFYKMKLILYILLHLAFFHKNIC